MSVPNNQYSHDGRLGDSRRRRHGHGFFQGVVQFLRRLWGLDDANDDQRYQWPILKPTALFKRFERLMAAKSVDKISSIPVSDEINAYVRSTQSFDNDRELCHDSVNKSADLCSKKQWPIFETQDSKSLKSFPFETDPAFYDDATRRLLSKCWEFRSLMTRPCFWNYPGDGTIFAKLKGKMSGYGTFQDRVREMNPGGDTPWTDYFQATVLDEDGSNKVVLTYSADVKRIAFFERKVGGGNCSFAMEYCLDSWTIEDVRVFFGGFWLERFLHMTLLNTCENMGLTPVFWKNAFTPHGEVDLVLFFGSIYYLFEVKTGRHIDAETVKKFEEKVDYVRESMEDNNVYGGAKGVFVCLQDEFQDDSFLNSVMESNSVSCVYGSKMPKIFLDDAFLGMTPGEVWNRCELMG